MKALEILKELNQQINISSNYDYTIKVHYNKAYQARVKAAIKEIEEYIKNKKELI